MKSLILIALLVLGTGLPEARPSLVVLPDAQKNPSFPEFICPDEAVYCFAELDPATFDFGPADDFFGETYEVVTRFQANGQSFSQLKFWGLVSILSLSPGKTILPPAGDFRINIYAVENGAPGGLLAGPFVFEAKEADEVLASSESSFVCMYNVSLGSLSVDEGFIGITRINNPLASGGHEPTKRPAEPFLFFLLGDENASYLAGESFYSNYTLPGGKDPGGIIVTMPSSRDEKNTWEAIPFKPFFALHNQAEAIPLGSLSLYLGMLLILGASVLYFRKG